MELNINICTNNSCKIVVEDKTEIGGLGYLKDNSNVISKNLFRYADTMSVVVLRHNRTNNPEDKSILILPHTKEKKLYLDIQFDGWFTVKYLVLPTKEWFDKLLESNTLTIYNNVYYTDGKVILKYLNGTSKPVELLEVLEINTDGSTISRIEKDYFSVCNLLKCFVNHSQVLFNGRLNLDANKSKLNRGGCFSNVNPDGEIIFKRDITWSALNVIKYMVGFNLLAEALRIIELIGGCNGLCKNLIYNNSTYLSISGCGCNK